LPAAAITVAGRVGGASFRASARAPALSRSIDRRKRRIPARLARSVSAAAKAVPTPRRCHSSTTSTATSASSNSSRRDVAGDPDRRPRRRRERDQRLVMPVVDVDQALQLARSQGRLAREVALIPGALAEPAKCERDRPSVGAGELADRDARHLAPLTELTPRM
jgi:hypothetical protein